MGVDNVLHRRRALMELRQLFGWKVGADGCFQFETPRLQTKKEIQELHMEEPHFDHSLGSRIPTKSFRPLIGEHVSPAASASAARFGMTR